jgi:rare lipoprotein A
MRRSAQIFAGLVIAVVTAGGDAWAQTNRHFSGLAAYYDKGYKGRTASGVPYDPAKLTAAHRTLPFGTRVRVTDKSTGRSVVVEVNDRGPFNKGRVIDLSLAAAKELHILERGLTPITAAIE